MCPSRPNFDTFAASMMNVPRQRESHEQCVVEKPRPLTPLTGVAGMERNHGGGRCSREGDNEMVTDNAIASLVLICASLAIAAAFTGAYWY